MNSFTSTGATVIVSVDAVEVIEKLKDVFVKEAEQINEIVKYIRNKTAVKPIVEIKTGNLTVNILNNTVSIVPVQLSRC